MKKLILFLSFLTFLSGTGFNGINLGDSVQEVASKL